MYVLHHHKRKLYKSCPSPNNHKHSQLSGVGSTKKSTEMSPKQKEEKTSTYNLTCKRHVDLIDATGKNSKRQPGVKEEVEERVPAFPADVDQAANEEQRTKGWVGRLSSECALDISEPHLELTIGKQGQQDKD